MFSLVSLSSDVVTALGVALPLFLIGVLSPGPATLAIMTLSAKSGRRHGLVFALGVCFGSLFWGTAAAVGLAGLLTLYAGFISVLKIAGGLYLFWLAFKSLRSCWERKLPSPSQVPQPRKTLDLFYSGLLLHLLNPKAIFVWLAVVAIGSAKVSQPSILINQTMVMVCWSFSVLAFTGYAFLFSTKPIVGLYRRCAKLIDGLCGMLFAAAGVKILSEH